MSETVLNKIEHESRIPELTKEEITEIGGACIAAANRDDFDAIVAAHVEMTGGRPHTNSTGREIQIGNPEGVAMKAEHSYRTVDGRALKDLVESGIVRGAYTATGGERASTSSHTTYWGEGVEGRNRPTGAGVMFEAKTDDVKNGWITADKLTAVYVRDAEGNMHDAIALHKESASDVPLDKSGSS